LLFVRGVEVSTSPAGEDLSEIKLVLEAPLADVCAAWVAAGESMLPLWPELLSAASGSGCDMDALLELVSSLLPSLPAASDAKHGVMSKALGRRGRRAVLETWNWLQPTTAAATAAGKVVGKIWDVVDEVTGVPVAGPVLRVGLLLAQAAALAVLADEHEAVRVAVRPYHTYIVGRCFYRCKCLNSRTRRQQGGWHPHPYQQLSR